MVARSQTPRVRWDAHLSTNQRREDLHHHLGLLVVGSIAETDFGSVRKAHPEIYRLWYPVLNVRWTVASVCVLEGTISAAGQA